MEIVWGQECPTSVHLEQSFPDSSTRKRSEGGSGFSGRGSHWQESFLHRHGSGSRNFICATQSLHMIHDAQGVQVSNAKVTVDLSSLVPGFRSHAEKVC